MRASATHNTDHREGEHREDHEHHAGAGGHAPAALELPGHREHVAEDRGDAEDVGAAVAVDREPGEGGERALEDVHGEDQGAGLPAEEAEGVGRARVAGALGGDVDPPAARHEGGAREGPEQVGHGHQECHLDAGVHRSSIQLPTRVGPHSVTE